MFTLSAGFCGSCRASGALSLLAGLLLYWFLSRSLIDPDEDFAVPGITAPVEIVRNNDDVPHIFGKTDRDVFFALGFAHAQDRLWQMTMLRRTAQGRLSELFGSGHAAGRRADAAAGPLRAGAGFGEGAGRRDAGA
jgi:acyl-homoserine lactone acylase PvdQ